MLLRLWDRLEAVIIGVMAGLALVLACYEMATRYFAPRHSLDWALEVQIYLLVGAIFLAGSGLVTRGRHVRADILVRTLGPQTQRWFEVFTCAVGAIFCAIIAYYGVDVVGFARMVGEVSESSLLFPKWIYYAILPIGFGLMAVRYTIRLYQYLFRFDPETMAIGEEPLHAE